MLVKQLLVVAAVWCGAGSAQLSRTRRDRILQRLSNAVEVDTESGKENNRNMPSDF